jgi:hypothetical protein
MDRFIVSRGKRVGQRVGHTGLGFQKRGQRRTETGGNTEERIHVD